MKSALNSQDQSKRALERARSCGYSCHSNGQCIIQTLSLFLSKKKTLLLNKACLKFAARHLRKPFDYCENVARSDETKNKSKAPRLALHMTFEISQTKVQRWTHHGMGLCLFSWYSTSCTKNKTKQKNF